jgi:alpha-N-acetylgalactosaminidase
MADRLVQDGYRDLGYEFVNIDDCWSSHERDSEGRLQADPDRFPNGIKFLADYVHSRGLKLGIYGDMGELTCGGYPGSLGHIDIDAKTFAEWGVDSLKLDGCYGNAAIYAEGYPNMSRALNATGRPIIFSCSWPDYIENPNYTAVAKYCNLWRNYDDIQDSWDGVLGIILYYAENQDIFQQFAGPGHWNDPDQLIIGDFGLSLDQQMAQMALWAIYASPLLMSNDLRQLPEESREILQNQEVIAVNQDKLGVQGRLVTALVSSLSDCPKETTKYIFLKPLSTNSVAVAMLNTGSGGTPEDMSIMFKDVGVSTDKAAVRDLFAHRDLGVFNSSVTVSVNPSGSVRLLLLTPVSSFN